MEKTFGLTVPTVTVNRDLGSFRKQRRDTSGCDVYRQHQGYDVGSKREYKRVGSRSERLLR
jgi:hypothetical protein